jgi:hypothetical protein
MMMNRDVFRRFIAGGICHERKIYEERKLFTGEI